MTLHEVLERAAEMEQSWRWQTFVTVCGGTHDVRTLPRTTTGGNPGPPYYCPICFTVYSAASFRMWNQPAREP
jgi:hypothetical protein